MNSKKVIEFKDLISNQDLHKFLNSVSIKTPTKSQTSSIGKLLSGGDYTIQGRTGSGKTLAYLLPLFEKLKNLEAQGDQSDEVGSPKAVILLPTRELALQVFGVAKEISHFAKLRVRKLVGGDKGKSLQTLFSSAIDILVTTPDRGYRTFQNKELSISEMTAFILDEADQLLEPSFRKTVEKFVNLVDREGVQVTLVSASRPENFDEIVGEFFPQRKFTTLGGGEENLLNHKVETYNFNLEDSDKFVYINSFIEKQMGKNGLVFTGNKARARKVFELIEKTGMKKVFLLHKDLEVKERVEVVDQFRKGGGILVATDLFARGIDINHLQWVLNFDLPSEPDYYLHRSGRVGRAGRFGNVFNFITSKDGKRQKRINEALSTQGRFDLKIPSKTTKRR